MSLKYMLILVIKLCWFPFIPTFTCILYVQKTGVFNLKMQAFLTQLKYGEVERPPHFH